MTIRISIDSAGNESEFGMDSQFPAISGNGRYVTYASTATNLVPDKTDNYRDIFVYDQTSRVSSRVSIDTTGASANNSSDLADISDDGHYIAFESYADDLIANDANGTSDIFLRYMGTR
ncbi:hypothetical protein BH10ACT2_BH10ACT2_23950 [soil metagenome]